MAHWVAPHLTGGLGNRLFQYAAAAGVAARWKRPLVFFLPRCQPTDHGPFENIFRLFPETPVEETAVTWTTIEEPRHKLYHYVPFSDAPPSTEPIVIHGWRQSEKYFPSSGIRPNFEAALGSEAAARIRATVPSPETTWFVHVRLGDYKVLPHHQVDLTEYYAHCLQQIPQGSTLVLFSDEPHLVEAHFRGAAETLGLNFDVETSADELTNLYRMSLCKGGVITANSTFSWWGAYFAHLDAPSTFKAYYPAVWGQGMPPPVDLIPSWGERMDFWS